MRITNNNKFGIPKVIESNTVNLDLSNSFAFRSWSYATVVVKLKLYSKGDNIYIDTGYSITLINKL